MRGFYLLIQTIRELRLSALKRQQNICISQLLELEVNFKNYPVVAWKELIHLKNIGKKSRCRWACNESQKVQAYTLVVLSHERGKGKIYIFRYLPASHTRKFCISNSQATSSGEHDSGLFFIRLSHTLPQAVPLQFHLLLNWGLLLVSNNEDHRAS